MLSFSVALLVSPERLVGLARASRASSLALALARAFKPCLVGAIGRAHTRWPCRLARALSRAPGRTPVRALVRSGRGGVDGGHVGIVALKFSEMHFIVWSSMVA